MVFIEIFSLVRVSPLTTFKLSHLYMADFLSFFFVGGVRSSKNFNREKVLGYKYVSEGLSYFSLERK